MTVGSILHRSLEAGVEVGANRRGAVSGAGWLYALPRLGFERIVHVGAPSIATLTGLARAGSRVDIVERSPMGRERVTRDAEAAGLTGVSCVADASGLADEPAIDLVVVGGGAARRRRDVVDQILDRLAPTGIAVLMEPAKGWGPVDAGGERGWLDLALTPGRGEVRSAVPTEDRAMRRTIEDLGLVGRWIPHPLIARLARRSPAALMARLAGGQSRTATVMGPAGVVGPDVPAYIREVASTAGRDLSGWGWGVAARGDYDSQKVLMLLRPPKARQPGGLVKITRGGAHGARLENEARALERLADLPLAAGRVPVPWFAGAHAGRVLLGESMITGDPFVEVARWAPDDPHLADAAGWLTELGRETRLEVPPAAMAEALATLLTRYAQVYRPSAEELAGLGQRFDALGRIGAPLPTVFQHGDPGIWNLLVDRTGRTVFLDWEAAEPDGLPLWDLFYLVRSYAIATSRRSGTRDRLDAAARHLLDGSPLGDRIVGMVEAYRDRVGLPPEAVEPLLYGCWVHRSLKEASRMAPERLASGQFVRLIRRMLAAPDAPLLTRLAGRSA